MNIMFSTPYYEPGRTYKTTYASRIKRVITKIMRNTKDAPQGYVREIGCHVQDLRTHIEKQFNNGMTWDHYGWWEIQHIDPKSWFNMDDQRDVFRCFHWSNLRPVWCEDNPIRRGRKGEKEYQVDYEALKQMTPMEYWREKTGQGGQHNG